jgi:signal transduction histidine kinase
MTGQIIKPLNLTSRAFARLAGWLVLAGASLSAAGWIAGIPKLTDLAGNGITIKFNMAVCLILVSLALLSVSYLSAHRVFVWFFGGCAVLIALATLSQYVTAIDLGIDTLLYTEPQGTPGTFAPGRMGMLASASVAMLGVAVVMATMPRVRRYSGIFSLTAFSMAAFSLSGYAFGAEQLYSWPGSTGIALQAAFLLAVLALGVDAAVPDHGLAAIFTRADAGAVMMRRSLLPLIAITIIMRYLVRLGLANDLYDREFAAALVTLSEILIFTGLLWWTAQSVSEAELRSVEAQKILAENQMHRRVATTQRAERQRLAGDLHDEIGQQVTALRLELQALCEQKQSDPPLADELNRLCDKLKKLDAEISMLAWEMRPAKLDSDGLVASLEQFGREWSKTYRIAFDFHAPSKRPDLSHEAENNLYRISQEALNNVLKHANATHVGMTLNFTDGEALLTIEDDGRGFDHISSDGKNAGGGFGLVGMRERAALIGGDLEIESGPGKGTSVFVRVPLAGSSDHNDSSAPISGA